MRKPATQSLSEDALKSIHPDSLRTYLERNEDWQKGSPSGNPALDLYESKLTNSAVRVLKNRDYAGYSLRMWENLAELSRLEERPSDQILR